MTGKVWLVGAGPSGAGLLTLRAKKVIEQADAVLYDALIGRDIVDIIPKTAEKIYVGKRAGHHSIPQEEINRLLLSLAKQGKRTVRLKGGDPFLFGRGGEELELLSEHQIPFEVVPGVTSATAVPVCFGIPVTHRGLSAGVHIITGHQKEDEPLQINYQALREAGGTLLFFMGIAHLHHIVEGLLEAGMDAGTPAAILQRGGESGQRKICGTLGTLEEQARGQEVLTPAIIIVGEVVRLGEKFAWFERLPLFGKKFIVTRPRERAGELTEKLCELGGEILELPTIATEGIHPNEALRAALADSERYRFLVFTSPGGVSEFMAELFDMGKDVRYLSGVSIAAIGSGTAKVLRQYGIRADLVPEIYSGKALADLLLKNCEAGDRVLLARSDIGNPELASDLRRAGISVTDISVYITHEMNGKSQEGEGTGRKYVAEIDGEAQREVQESSLTDADGVFFTSASTVRGFVSGFTGVDFSRIQAFCIGEMTAEEAKKHGMRVRTAGEATVEGLVELALSEA